MWWNPFAVLTRHEKRLNDLHQALTSHVTANISRLDLVEKQQRDLNTVICNHKDENARQLERIGETVAILDKHLRGHTWSRRLMVLYRIINAVTCLVGVIVVGAIVMARPDSIPYLAQIVESVFHR